MNNHFRTLWVAMALLSCAIPGYSQFNAGLYNFGPNLLMTSCLNGQPLGPETVVHIFWDANGNGPDAADQQPVVGDGYGMCNYNSFTLQSGYDFGVPGGFYVDPTFTISTVTPEPSLYYVVTQVGLIRWTSAVFTISNGLNDYDLGAMNWTCEEIHLPLCDEPTYIFLDHSPNEIYPYYTCVQLCADTPVQICASPFPSHPEQRPIVTITPGCMSFGCAVECPPAQFGFDPSAWIRDPETGNWCNWIIAGPTDGCVCVIEEIFPVEYAGFEAQPRDGENLIIWSTASEQGVDYFRLRRDSQIVHTVAGSNSATGNTYSFSDENLTNGRAYTYSLEVVNLDGTVDSWPNVTTATPSLNSAIITEYALHQNFPNPFNPATSIVFDVLEEKNVNLRVFNSMGQEVATLVNSRMNSGRHTVEFDASKLTSGLYFYTVKIGTEFTSTKKMMLIK